LAALNAKDGFARNVEAWAMDSEPVRIDVARRAHHAPALRVAGRTCHCVVGQRTLLTRQDATPSHSLKQKGGIGNKHRRVTSTHVQAGGRRIGKGLSDGIDRRSSCCPLGNGTIRLGSGDRGPA
jgi:hypothetical protein